MIGYTKTSSEKVFLKKLVLFHALEIQLYNIFMMICLAVILVKRKNNNFQLNSYKRIDTSLTFEYDSEIA